MLYQLIYKLGDKDKDYRSWYYFLEHDLGDDRQCVSGNIWWFYVKEDSSVTALIKKMRELLAGKGMFFLSELPLSLSDKEFSRIMPTFFWAWIKEKTNNKIKEE